MKFFKKLLEKEQYLVLSIMPLFIIILLILIPNDSSYWFQYWWMFPIAFLIALTVNTVGISGAALFVPFFIILFPLLAGQNLLAEQSIKLGLITESFGLTSSALAFLKFGLIDKKLGFKILLGAVPFVIAGSIITFFIPQYLIKLLIATTLLFSVYLVLNKKRNKSKNLCIDNEIIGSHHKSHENGTLIDRDGKEYKYCRQCSSRKRFFGFSIGGLFQGMAGFGIGELGIVSMITSGIPFRVAIGTSHLIVALTAIVASSTHIIQSTLNNIITPWNIVIMTVPAVILGGQIAPYISARIKGKYLEYIVSTIFIVLAISLIFIAFKKV